MRELQYQWILLAHVVFINHLIICFMRIELSKVIKEHPNLIIQMTAGNLRDFLDYLIFEIRSMTLAEAKATERDDRLMTIDEASRFLSVSKMTLYRWYQVGILKKVEIGSKRRYRKTDVERLIGCRLGEDVDNDI